MPRFLFRDFGCRANQAEGAAAARTLEQAGWGRTAEAEEAEWAVLNTCTVTAEADAEARRALRQLRRLQPGLRVAVTGCYARRAPEEVAQLAGVEVVAGHATAAGLAARLGAGGSGLPKLATAAAFERVQALTAPERTRPMLKVQEGCSRRCSYCVVPMVRGAHRSVPLGEVLAGAEEAAAGGAQELVISGINLGEWGRDLGPGLGLAELVRAILERTRLPRLRLSSVEPGDWSAGLETLLGAAPGATGPRLARHAHLPLQSGSDTVLARMHRRYRAAEYAEQVLRLRRAAPEAAIGADVMTGFPGESEAEFEQTRALVAELPLTYLHVFTFSSRQGTEAARRLERGDWSAVPAAVAAARAATLRKLGTAKQRAFRLRMVGRRLWVVTLQGAPGTALSDNFLPVALSAPTPANQLIEVEVTGAAEDHLLAVPLLKT